MMKFIYTAFLVVAMLIRFEARSQGVAINNDNSAPDPSAMLDVKSTDKGLLIPRMTQAQRTTILTPANGLLVYQTDSPSGFYYFNGNGWFRLSLQNEGWSTMGNAGTNPSNNFIGTTDNVPLFFKVNNAISGRIDHTLFNTSLGYNALPATTSGQNTAIGYNALSQNTSGSKNTAIGIASMQNNLTGYENIAIGWSSLLSNQAAAYNIAIGDNALTIQSYNPGTTYASDNVAVGHYALRLNQPTSVGNGNRNTAIGNYALESNTTGYYSTAVGFGALDQNTSGYYNTANGGAALYNNSIGYSNVAIGYSSLYQNTAASLNIAIGKEALRQQSYNPGAAWASHNIAIGAEALYNNQPLDQYSGIINTAIGNFVLKNNTTGSSNTAIGYYALNGNLEGNGNIGIGNWAQSMNTYGFSNTSVGFRSISNNYTGSRNTAVGTYALSQQSYDPGYAYNTDNVAVGYYALNYNQPSSTSNGIKNTAVGTYAAYNNNTGLLNTAVGHYSAYNTTTGFENTSLGANSLVNNYTGSYNTAIGYNTGPNVSNISNTTCLGTDATATATDMVRIGNVFVNSIGGQVGWTTLSDRRFKENVKEDVHGLDFVLQLRPVTFQINRESVNDFTGVSASHEQQHRDNPELQFVSGQKYSPITTGFIAQEVEQAAQNCGFQFSGVDKPKNENDMYGLRYAEFVVPLVKAVQELAMQNEQMKKEIEDLKKELKAKMN